MPYEFTESWPDLATRFEGYRQIPQALHCAALLRQAIPRWEGRVIAASWWVHGMRFVRALPDGVGDEIRVQWSEGAFEFTLHRGRLGQVIAADRCRTENGPSVLDAFLVQLAGGEVPPS